MEKELSLAIEFINKIEEYGYQAFIVGGFVRDYLLNIKTSDIDITTSATPKIIKKIFNDVKVKKSSYEETGYGSVIVTYKKHLFEVTTFREESTYLDNRHPSSIKYIDNLEIDLKRRDFTINAICIDKNNHVIDYLNGSKDLKKKVIKTIKEPVESFQEDAIRILRAIRFSINLNFKLDKNVIEAIDKTKKYLKNISYERKKNELDKIFASHNAYQGIELIKKLNLDLDLELENLDRIKDYTDLMGIWAMINSNKYPFTKHEKELIKKINKVYKEDNLNKEILYKNGLYVNILAGINKGLSKKKITMVYNNLPIKTRKDINISATDICQLLNKKPDSFLQNIYCDLEKMILEDNLENKKDTIIDYIKNKYLN